MIMLTWHDIYIAAPLLLLANGTIFFTIISFIYVILEIPLNSSGGLQVPQKTTRKISRFNQRWTFTGLSVPAAIHQTQWKELRDRTQTKNVLLSSSLSPVVLVFAKHTRKQCQHLKKKPTTSATGSAYDICLHFTICRVRDVSVNRRIFCSKINWC